MATPTATFLGLLATALSAPERVRLDSMSSDLRFILSEFEIPDRIQLRAVELGYKSLALFAVLGDDRPSVRALIATDFFLNAQEPNLDADLALQARLMSAQILAAWLSAGTRATEEAKQSADNRLLRLPNLISRTALTALRMKYELAHTRVSDKIYPCASLLEKRMEEVEEGGITAPPLTEVISVEEADDEQIQLSDNGSNIRIRKAPKAIPQPATTEQLRQRLRTLSIAYTIVSYKHSSRLWLRTSTHDVWLNYTDYLLSDQVASYNLDTDGCSIKAAWKTVLEYDMGMRKLACRKITYDGQDFKTAIEFAMNDLQCRERYFVTPTALINASLAKKPHVATGTAVPPPLKSVSDPTDGPSKHGKLKSRKQAQRARQKERAKSEAKSEAVRVLPPGFPDAKRAKIARTPDGRNICGFFQLPAGCRKQNCSYLHVCDKCYGNHPAHKCTTGKEASS